jgi:sensor histidine kinase regulating citrate/malate metabolism
VNPLFGRIIRIWPRSLQLRLSLLVIALLVLLVSLIGVLSSDSIRGILLHQIGKRTLVLAQAVALNPIVREGLQTRKWQEVQAVAEQVRRATAAEYIVVCDREGIRYSHPRPERIGELFVGGDFQPAVEEGKSYVSMAVGTLGPSMRGFVPVHDDSGLIIGFVAVGYLEDEIEKEVGTQQHKIVGYVAVVLFFGAFGAALIAKSFKAAIFGLEPHEIAGLFEERNAIIEAIREGVVAVDGAGRLTLVNQAARRYLDQTPELDLRGCQLTDICPCQEMEEALAARVRVLDREVSVGGRPMIVNVLPLGGGGAVSGAVASFRPKDELDHLARKLLHMQEYSELLRAQTHEYSNKLHTIAGLIQIGAQQEALDLVMTEASGYQELMKTLAEAVPDPVVAGIILGKFNRARELKISLSLEPDSSFADLPPHIERGSLVTVLGNLLDNAFDAVREAGEHGEVRLFLTDLGLDLIIEVEDSGQGVSPEVADNLFDRGVTTHSITGRGMGLYLVRRAVEALGGNITFAEGELGGALFTVIIPKSRTKEPGTRQETELRSCTEGSTE